MGPDSPLVPLDVLRAICALRPVITLLTNVRQIAWSSVCVPDECLPYLLSIIGQDLSVFDMAWEESEDLSVAIPAALEQLAAQPCLRELTLLNRQLPTNRAASLSFSTFLRQSHLLTKMVCDAIAIPAEAALPNLLIAHVRLPNPISSIAHVTGDPFPSLETFSAISTAASYSTFSQAVALSHVNQFILYLESPTPEVDIASLFLGIRQQLDADTTLSLTVRSAEDVDSISVNREAVLPGHIHALFELKKLVMEPPPRCVVNDGLCHDMAKAWPDVEELCYAHMSWRPWRHSRVLRYTVRTSTFLVSRSMLRSGGKRTLMTVLREYPTYSITNWEDSLAARPSSTGSSLEILRSNRSRILSR